MNKFMVLLLIMSFINSINAQWQILNSGTDLNLKGVFFIDNEKGWAVGSEGIILYTANGGDNWTEQTSGTDFTLESVYFNNPYNGWIAGGKEYAGIILRTDNGGGTWEEMYIDDPNYYLNDICFTDDLNGWAVGEKHVWTGFWGKLLHSTDGGETWITQDSIPPYSWPYSLPLKGVHFIDPDNGWVVGSSMAPSSGYIYCFIMNTNDGGITWEEQINYSSRNGYWLNSVCFTGTLNGWAAGPDGWVQNAIILKTIDGGNNWDTSYLNNSCGLHSIYFTDSIKGWTVGNCGAYPNDSGTIMHTSNGGETWEEQLSGTTEVLNSVCFIDPENGWVVGGSGTILHTNSIVGVNEYSTPENNSIRIIPFPNPFTTSTTLSFTLDKPATITISIFNPQGQLIEKIEQEQPTGEQQVQWNAVGLPTGMYYFRIQSGDKVGGSKMVKL
jgi:photosystem II stability/assembly factor-like uncharacterized protein